jgi:hypothetical protein
MRRINTKLFALIIACAALPGAASEQPPGGLIAASVGNQVVLVHPSSGASFEMVTGPVGWLFPAPGGVLYAPDVINGRTTVIDMRTQMVAERIDGLTMPYFGDSQDRYIALAGEVMLVSYPERAVMARIPAEIAHPWQAIVSPDDAAMMILERLPDGSTGVHMTTVNLITRQLVYRRPLAGDIVHMALSTQLGLLALADVETDRIRLVEPATLMPMADFPTPGPPRDVVFASDGKIMVTAIEHADGTGALHLGLFKRGKKGLRLDKEHTLELPAAPVRVDQSPDGEQIAVALDNGVVQIISVNGRKVIGTVQLPGTPRDLRWCDPSREGPSLPDWSDGKPPELDLGGFEPKYSDDKSSGLEEPIWKKPPN